jgi:hypothetical protein
MENSKGVHSSVNIPSGAASTSCQLVTPSTMDVEITSTTRVWSTSDFSGDVGPYMTLALQIWMATRAISGLC